VGFGRNWKRDAIIKTIGDLGGVSRALHIAEKVPRLTSRMVGSYITNNMLGRYVDIVRKRRTGAKGRGGSFYNTYGLNNDGWDRYWVLMERELNDS